MNRERQRGGAGLKAVFWILVLVAFGYVCYKVVPPYLANYQLQDKMMTEARFASVNRRTDEEIRENVYREMQDLEIPARREDIKVQNTGRAVRISVEYTVPVDLQVYQLNLRFTPTAENRSVP